MPNILPAVEEVYVDITKGLYDQGLCPQTPEGGIYGPTTHDIYYYDITIFDEVVYAKYTVLPLVAMVT